MKRSFMKPEIAKAWADLKCERLAGDEAAARKRHAKRPSTLEALQKANEASN